MRFNKKAVKETPLTAFSIHFRKTQNEPKTVEGIIMEEEIFIFILCDLLLFGLISFVYSKRESPRCQAPLHKSPRFLGCSKP